MFRVLGMYNFAGSSKTALRILIFSIAIGADYSYEVINSEILVPAFFKHTTSFIATVRSYGAFHWLIASKGRLMAERQQSQFWR